MKSALLLCAAVLVSGCAAGRLYPVQGPLAAQLSPPIYKIKMEYGDGISATLARREECQGRWLDVVQEDPTARELSAEWDLVYGKGYFVANVLGHPGIARATLTCAKGTKVTVEFDSMKGVAKDENGNVFKLTF
ncbi:MAG: hypothetical protein WA825_06725 [Steroidobacteraceae bacterium]